MKHPPFFFRSLAALAALSVWGPALPAPAADDLSAPSPLDLPAGEAVLPVQGRLRQAGLVPGALQTIEFRLYAGAGSVTPVWGESVAVLLDTNGVFNVMLREGLGAKLAAGRLSDVIRDHAAEPLFLGLTPDANGELVPRTPIRVQGRARHAAYALAANETFEVPAGTVSCDDFLIRTGGTLSADEGELQGLVSCDSVETTGETTVQGNVVLRGRDNKVTGSTIVAGDGFTGRGSVPVGTIISWYGDLEQLPEGWALCDGRDGRPDLREKFIRNMGRPEAARGSDFTGFNEQGGQNFVALRAENLPGHTHSFERVSPQITDTDYMWVATKSDSGDKFWGGKQVETTKTTGDPDSSPLGEKHENRPPFCGLYFIIRVQ